MEITEKPEKVLVTGISMHKDDFNYTMHELAELARGNGMEVVGEVRQNIEKPYLGTYFGHGKIREIKALAAEKDATTIIVNNELTPSQINNLEKLLGTHIMDRTELILQIFAMRAHTKQAKTQVEIAQLQYQLPRLHPSANTLDQQRGGTGGVSNRGTGETQLELDRRVIKKRISHLRQVIKETEKEQQIQKAQRKRHALPTVALVGYTNAGKSTTMNGLLRLFNQEGDHKQVFEKNMLFATLDTSVREITLPSHRHFLLSDTVGFVSNLPHNLVESFKATLAEAAEADLLIQVVDYADPNYPDMMATTAKTLEEIGITQRPMIIGFNKADLKPNTPYPEINGDELIYSARDEQSLKVLAQMIERKLFTDYHKVTFMIPFTDGQIVSRLESNNHIISKEYTNEGTKLTVEVKEATAARLQKYVVTDENNN
ncbi:MAG: GTPase HflX [Candidatus Paralactobacillus gallistercoris]|uniref:GTPase HflX n=1 Tax=Candidatus Paralactobacillus gallistercoris TaxID=2838724 RepID=A0A948X2T4_9LACO|nr:GTPase HflX [Candidatus Paralactobacillus gallistercoris]